MSPFVNMSALLVLMSLLHCGSAGDEKLTDCCTSVSRNRINDPIIGVLKQSKSGNCVEALIFQTENRALFCIYPKAPWVRSALLQLKRKQVRSTARAAVLTSAQAAPTSTQAAPTSAQAAPLTAAPGPQVSLLSIITSTVQPSSASSMSPSSSSGSPSSSSGSPSSSSGSPSSSGFHSSTASPDSSSFSSFSSAAAEMP